LPLNMITSRTFWIPWIFLELHHDLFAFIENISYSNISIDRLFYIIFIIINISYFKNALTLMPLNQLWIRTAESYSVFLLRSASLRRKNRNTNLVTKQRIFVSVPSQLERTITIFYFLVIL
jgi:hypothetical protein